jgi:uncharacterized protein
VISSQALVIFARLPRKGDVKTRLGKSIGMHKSAELYRLFAEHAFTLGRQLLVAGSTVYVFYDPGANADEMRAWVGPSLLLVPQEGATLGDRMRRAFDVTFAEESKQTIIIGTDVPELDLLTIERGYDALHHHDAVIGPASDGGYYLLGMNAPTKELFDGIAWSSGTVYRDTVEHLRRLNLSFCQLNELADIDTISDYEAYLGRMQKVNTHPER